VEALHLLQTLRCGVSAVAYVDLSFPTRRLLEQTLTTADSVLDHRENQLLDFVPVPNLHWHERVDMERVWTSAERKSLFVYRSLKIIWSADGSQ
jgi:hypothetical protein